MPFPICNVVCSRRSTRHSKKDAEGVFKFSYPEVCSAPGSRKRQHQGGGRGHPEKNSKQKNMTAVSFASPYPQSTSTGPQESVPSSPAFNQSSTFSAFKQSTPMSQRRTATKRESPMKRASAYKTPEKKKRIYSSDEEDLEFRYVYFKLYIYFISCMLCFKPIAHPVGVCKLPRGERCYKTPHNGAHGLNKKNAFKMLCRKVWIGLSI